MSTVLEAAPAPPPRRAEVERAFAHIAGLAATADVAHIEDPQQQFVVALRHIMNRYGDVGDLPPLDGVRIEAVSADGVPAEWIAAEDADPRHRVVWTHGGGWMGGAPSGYRHVAAVLSRASGASVLVVDYRLAPEYRFPAGLEDCYTALQWAASNGPDGPSTAVSLSVVGDSSGGNLAAATCLLAAGRGTRLPDRLVIIAGVLDNIQKARPAGRDDPIAPPQALAASLAIYLPPDVMAADPLVSPLHAPAELLARFPPTLVQASDIETLLGESRRFAAALEGAGARAAFSVWPGLPHVWHAFLGLLPEAREALGEIADFISAPRRVRA